MFMPFYCIFFSIMRLYLDVWMCLLETLVCFLWSLGLLALTLRLISNLFYVLCFEIPYEILASMSWFRFEIHFGPPMHVNSLIETWNAVFMDSFCSYPVLCFVTSFCSWNSQIPSPWGKALVWRGKQRKTGWLKRKNRQALSNIGNFVIVKRVEGKP